MKIQLIRHATTILFYNNKKLLVDPILSEKGTMSPIEYVPNQNLNPLVDLPVSVSTEYIIDCDAVLLTHTHRDHFDETAIKCLPKDMPIFCQPKDKCKITDLGFSNLYPVYSSIAWNGITISRTGGRHGHGATALTMAPVSGYVLSSSNEATLYITGDTVWCSQVRTVLKKYNPEMIIAYSGSAQFAKGKPITMNTDDLLNLTMASPNAKIVIIHMEAWNHCRLSRNELRDFIKTNGLTERFLVPSDGQLLTFHP